MFCTCALIKTTFTTCILLPLNYKTTLYPEKGTIQRETFERENFRELVKNTIFVEKTFMDCSLMPKDNTPPNFVEKTFMNSHKIANSQKFSPSKVFRYMVISPTPQCCTVFLVIYGNSFIAPAYQLHALLGIGEEWTEIFTAKSSYADSPILCVDPGDPGGCAMETFPKFNSLVCPTFAQEEGSGAYSL